MGIIRRKTQLWYAAGLAFKCTGCGRCCAGPEEGYIWVTRLQITEIAGYLGISVAEMEAKYVRKVGRRLSLVERKDNNDCIFLSPGTDDGRACAIYPVRPRQCRTWPFWPSNLRSCDDWADAQRRCVGINRGPIHSYDEIESKRKSTP